MATVKQRRAVEKLAENGGNVSAAMRAAGYSPISAATPKKLTESKGFYELCEQVGLTDDLILQALADDIKNKPKQRVKELALAARIKGMEKAPSGGSVNFIQLLLAAYNITPTEGGDAREANSSIQSTPSG